MWDIFVVFVLITYFFFIPVHIAINIPLDQLMTPHISIILHFFMITDIIFSMNTGYFEKGSIITDQRKIILHYMKKQFWTDIIA